jgi:hypothetical protein
MTDSEIIQWFESEDQHSEFVVFPDEIFDVITQEQAEMLSKRFSKTSLMKLPEFEILFFEWLKAVDPEVWDDLWKSNEEQPYIVGISFLPALIDKNGRGFPICDLLNEDNYYFSSAHLITEEAKMLVESVKARFLEKEKLTVEQLLALEISLSPIDIWHFAYKYELTPARAKEAVARLVADKVLIHIKEADKLADFVEM